MNTSSPTPVNELGRAAFHLRVPTAKPIRVFVVDDHPLFRCGMAAQVAADSACEWLGEACSGEEARRLAPMLQPDVVLVDQGMPGADGLTVVEQLKPHWPRARFILMAGMLPEHALRRLMTSGASCLDKGVTPNELMAAVRSVHQGERVMSPSIMSALEASHRSLTLRNELTPRELTLLELLAQGLDNRSISQTLDISVPTVKFHVTNIMSKLHASNRTAAVLAALRERLISVEAALGMPAMAFGDD